MSMTDAPAQHRVHLHVEDHSATLALLLEVLNGRSIEGYEPTEHGAWVDWDALASGWLSSTEKAVVQIARGCAVLERQGGSAPRLRAPLIATVTVVAR
jgi:hypothetical protein